MAGRLPEVVRPEVCVFDDVSFPERGRVSAVVARQYCGAVGKRWNWQVAVGVHAVMDSASCALERQLYVSRECVGVRIRGTAMRSGWACAGSVAAQPRSGEHGRDRRRRGDSGWPGLLAILARWWATNRTVTGSWLPVRERMRESQ
ncbi:transposase [Streptomyces griseorubiginosus]|uniref:transposase n=1 Tax=Streptomyces griseorubiginosus TaxID=67304 RepID=UPI003410F5E6